MIFFLALAALARGTAYLRAGLDQFRHRRVDRSGSVFDDLDKLPQAVVHFPQPVSQVVGVSVQCAIGLHERVRYQVGDRVTLFQLHQRALLVRRRPQHAAPLRNW